MKSDARGGVAWLRLVVGAAALALPLLCAACSSESKVEARTTTVGKELQDLDDARNKGLMTEEEYQKKRAEIMKSK